MGFMGVTPFLMPMFNSELLNGQRVKNKDQVVQSQKTYRNFMTYLFGFEMQLNDYDDVHLI